MGDIATDPLRHIIRNVSVVLQERLIVGKDEVHIIDMYKRIPVRARHVDVRLADDHLGTVHRGTHDVHTYPQAHVPMTIRKRCLHKSDIDRHNPPIEQIRDL